MERILAVALVTAVASALTAQPPAEPASASTLTAENIGAWRDHITSPIAERDWAELPWKMTFHDGLVAAAKAGKPLLLWTMNGHPFGCT